MQNYKIALIGDREIVQDLETNLLYITLESYAKIAEINILDAEGMAKREEKPGVIYDKEGWEGIDGNYLIPILFIFDWLWINHPNKARKIGAEAIAYQLTIAFNEVTIDD